MKLPPGPSQPPVMQTIGWWARPIAFIERCRERYGKRFTIKLLSAPPFVMHADPAHLKEIFTAPPEVLHPGEGARILEPVVGTNSVILLDEREHLSQRKLMLPAFHGEKMERLTGLMGEVADREVASWPRGEAVELHPRFQSLTLDIILRAVFGLDSGERLEAIRTRLTEILMLGSRPLGMFPFLQRDMGRMSPWRRFLRLREETDQLIFDLIEERRGDPSDRDDVLSMLLEARHEDGSPMSPQELRDELMTMLVAGHETTASELAWAFEQLVRAPHVLARLTRRLDV
jgi:cytochrome P450